MSRVGTELSMSRPVDVSVVISTFDRCASLRRTLDSLIDQRVPPNVRYEIVVVDNNCGDDTPDVVEQYVGLYPDLVRYAFEPRRGVSYGRNAGTRIARGSIVAFTDDDNVVSRTWVADVARLMASRPDMAGVGGRVLPDWQQPPPAWLDRRHWSPLAILDYGEHPFPTSMHRPLCLLTANLALRRDVIDRVGGFSPDFPRCQDHELLLRIWRSGERVLYAPGLMAFARVDPDRMTRRYHRRWHAQHGYFAAAMQLEEAIDERGQLRTAREHTARLFGVPGYVYTDAVRQAGRWLCCTIRRRPARAAHHEHRLRYLLAYVRRSIRLSRGDRSPLPLDAAEFAAAHLRRRARAVHMSAGRLAVVHLLIAALLGGSAYDIVTGAEHWPLSPYPMFSRVERSATLDSLLLAGVIDGPDAREMPLRDLPFIRPFDQCRLITAFQRVKNRDDNGATLRAMLRDSLVRYEQQREAGAHDGPRLQAVRIYSAHWTLDPQARNVDTPDELQLLGEVSAAEL